MDPVKQPKQKIRFGAFYRPQGNKAPNKELKFLIQSNSWTD